MDQFSEENYKDFYEIYRLDILQYIDPDRQFVVSYLRSKFVLDDDDCERIVSASITRQDKVSKFLSIMACKGFDALQHFVDALELEYPLLYHKVTGKKAGPRTIPTVDCNFEGPWNWAKGLAGKELIDFDRQFLATQLERATNDLQCMAYGYQKILEEKNNLERRLFEAEGDLELQEKYFAELREEVMRGYAERRAAETTEDALKTNQPLQFYLQELWQETIEKSNVIIALQGKLLALNEENSLYRKTVEELEQKNEKLKISVRELTINCDSERRYSKRLNETVRRKTDELMKLEDLNKKVLELRYHLGIANEERDNCRKELEEFQKWVEVLNARYDIVTQERDELRENTDDISDRYVDLQDRVENLVADLQESNYKCEVSEHEIERLKDILSVHKEQRKQLILARETAINEKSAALKELDAAEKMNRELQSTRDTAVNGHMALCHELEERYDGVVADLRLANDRLREKEIELDKVKKLMEKMKRSVSESSEPSPVDKTAQKNTDDDPATEKDVDVGGFFQSTEQEQINDEQSVISSTSSPLSRRSRRELVDSIRRKIRDDFKPSRMYKKSASLPTQLSPSIVQTFNFEQLNCIYQRASRTSSSFKSKLFVSDPNLSGPPYNIMNWIRREDQRNINELQLKIPETADQNGSQRPVSPVSSGCGGFKRRARSYLARSHRIASVQDQFQIDGTRNKSKSNFFCSVPSIQCDNNNSLSTTNGTESVLSSEQQLSRQGAFRQRSQVLLGNDLTKQQRRRSLSAPNIHAWPDDSSESPKVYLDQSLSSSV